MKAAMVDRSLFFCVERYDIHPNLPNTAAKGINTNMNKVPHEKEIQEHFPHHNREAL